MPAYLHSAPALTPQGHLLLAQSPDDAPLSAALADRLQTAFAQGAGYGLWQLAAGEVGVALPPAWGYWRDFAAPFVQALCALADADNRAARKAITPPANLPNLAANAPPMAGAEYLNEAVLAALWGQLHAAFEATLATADLPVQALLNRFNPAWNVVGRVHFNLAENRSDPEAPFAFMATYTSRLSARATAQHVPLAQAMREYAGPAQHEKLLSLLLPVQRASAECGWLKELVDSGDIFHPLGWTAREAFALLSDQPALERCGVVVRMPAQWGGKRPPRPKVGATIGSAAPSLLGMGTLLDFNLRYSLDDETLSAEDIQALLAGTDGLALLRGRWVEVDRAKLTQLLAQFQTIEAAAHGQGLDFGQAMRLLAGANLGHTAADTPLDADWAQVVAGPALAQLLHGLRSPAGLAPIDPGPALHAQLRPYQQTGLRWLHLLSSLGLGACLADDMGLGKTIQLLSLLLVLQRDKSPNPTDPLPSLLVVPASLLGNWAAEAQRFAPSLRLLVAHPSVRPGKEPAELGGVDLVITSYGALLRQPWVAQQRWRLLVIDEAQAIKNPASQQTRAVKALQAQARIALTGTPVENRLADLWSIFDFINPGLLGNAKAFGRFAKQLAEREHNPFGPLRALVQPYILRRLKSDKSVIADLPDKTELKAYCPLSPKQAALYQQTVQDLTVQLAQADGIQRRGMVLAALMRFKQICNHPSQWLGDGAWAEADSGKLARLRELCETIAAKQEKVLVFTQFRETTAPLAAFLGTIFGHPGLVLHGQTAIAQRKVLVQQFQEDEAVPFFVLSLKAGGAGLNLTAASHVIHFDRWWNPAVENQASDRAYRIGQKRNVLVHKFICQGTMEEKLDQLIESKRQLSTDLLEGTGGEVLLTEMSDADLLRMVALDLSATTLES